MNNKMKNMKALDNIYYILIIRLQKENGVMKMKKIGKATIVIVLGLVIVSVLYYTRNQQKNHVSENYSFVIKRFEKKSELVVADADVETNPKKTFQSKTLEEWPGWTKTITKFFRSRSLTLKIPVKTEFKLQLANLSKKDVTIKENVLTFNKPLTVNVDSQQNGKSKIDSSAGLLDRVVDAFTAGKKAQEFLEENSQDTIYKTSDKVMNNKGRQEKVATYAEEALENLLNLNSDKKIDVKIKSSDLKFVNVDPKK